MYEYNKGRILCSVAALAALLGGLALFMRRLARCKQAHAKKRR